MSREKFASAKFSDFIDVTELYRSPTGAIYKGKYKYDNKFYVMKEKKLSELGRAKDVMNEVKLLQQLRHGNVVQCEGWFRDVDRGTLVIVLEYCGGGDLSQIIEQRRKRKERFSESEIWFIFKQICQGVQHLHENGIIHRDIKALNIFYDPIHQKYKVGDLGVSRQVSEQTILVQTFYGTPLYLSPELVENRAYNEKTDIWSLGVLLYELCALKPPFMAPTLMALAKLVVAGNYEAISHSYSSHLKRCVAWMLTRDYHKRPSIVQVLDFIEDKIYSKGNNPEIRNVRSGATNDDDSSTETADDENDNTVDNDAETESDTASEDSVGVVVTANKIAVSNLSDNDNKKSRVVNDNSRLGIQAAVGLDKSVIIRDSLDNLVPNLRPMSSKSSSRLVPPPEILPVVPSIVPPPLLSVPPVPDAAQPSPLQAKARHRSKSPARHHDDTPSPNRQRKHKHSVKVRSPSPSKHKSRKNKDANGSGDTDSSDTEDILVLVSQARCVALHRRESTRLRKLLQTRDFLLSSANNNSSDVNDNNEFNDNVRFLHTQLAALRQDLQYLEQAMANGSLPLKIAKRLQVTALVKASSAETEKEAQVDKVVDEEVLPVYLQPGPRSRLAQASKHARDTEKQQHQDEETDIHTKLNAVKYEYLKLPDKLKQVQDRDDSKEEVLRPLPVSQQRQRQEQAQPAMIDPVRPKSAKKSSDIFQINVHFDNNSDAEVNNSNNKIYESTSNNQNHSNVDKNKEFDAAQYFQHARVPLKGTETPANLQRPPPLSKRELLAEKVKRLQAENAQDCDTGLLLPSMNKNTKRPSSAARHTRDTDLPSDKSRFYNHARHISDICSVMEKDPRFHRQESHVNVLLHPNDSENKNIVTPNNNIANNNNNININNNNIANHNNFNSNNNNVVDSGDKANRDDAKYGELQELVEEMSSVGHRERPKTAGGRRRLAEDLAAAAKAGFVFNNNNDQPNDKTHPNVRKLRHAPPPQQQGMMYILHHDKV